MQTKWSQENQVAILVCDTKGIILSMNNKAARIFKKSGGFDLVGKSLMDCHPEYARKKIPELISNNQSNCYTIEKGGFKAMLYQTPWYQDGLVMGLVEYIFDLPPEIPNRKHD
ncbi:MAG: hypothetical protein GXY50_03480 [Syntrophomonadaceae bacterium]|nr:hypothetical protein [Syntrophomonadaceae bacterium]